MHKPSVKIGENRTIRGVLVILLTSAMLLTSLMTLAETASRDQPKPDLGIAQFYSDNNKPRVGDVITLNVVVKNYVDTAAVTNSFIKVWVDNVTSDPQCTSDNQIVGPGETLQPFQCQFNTTGKRGTRHFFASIDVFNPKEANDTLANNNATLEVPVFNTADGFDNIYTGSTKADITGLKQYKGFIALFDNAQVNIKGDTTGVCNLKMIQDQDFEYGIELTGTSVMDISNCNITSNHKFYITVTENAKLWIESTYIGNGTIRSLSTNVSALLNMMDSTVMGGGIMIGTSTSDIERCNIQGNFVYTGGNPAIISWTNFNITKDAQAGISNTVLTADNVSFRSSSPIQILATDNAQVIFDTVWDSGSEKRPTISFDATDTARILISRSLHIHVADTTDLPIKDATIEAYSESSADIKNLYDTGVSDATGNLTMTLLSDIIVAGPDGYRGNYEFKGSFGNYQTAVTYRLGMHPDLSYNSSHDKLDIIFEPVPPNICPNPYRPTDNVINGKTLAFSGCMEINKAVTYVNSNIVGIQDHDFQAAIYIDGSGQLILENTSISSANRMNIYIITSAASLRTGDDQNIIGQSIVKVNAVVGVGGNVMMKNVIINGNIRGTYNSFQVTMNSTIRGTWLVSHASSLQASGDIISPDSEGTSNITAGTLTIGGGQFLVNHFEMTATSGLTIQDADMWGVSVPSITDDPTQFHFKMPGSSLILWSNGVCSIINTHVNYDKFEQHCKGFNGEKSVFDSDIIYSTESTSGSLKSTTVVAPHVVTVNGDATVLVWFHISLTITNSLNGPQNGATITITRVGGSTVNPPNSLQTDASGNASEDLLAEQITKGNNHQYLGNYKVIVHGCSQAQDYEFSVGMAKGDQHYDINFPGCVPAIEGLQYIDLKLNRTSIIPPNNDVEVSGIVRVSYEGGLTTPPNDKVHITVDVSSKTSNATISADTDMTGAFAIPLKLINKALDVDSFLIKVSASYIDPSAPGTTDKVSQTLNITVMPEVPKAVTILNLGKNAGILETKNSYQSTDTVTVSGYAKYDTGTPVQTGSTVSVQILGTHFSSRGTVGANGMFTLTIPVNLKLKKDTTFTILTVVTAEHPTYKTNLTGSKRDIDIMFKGEKQAATVPIFLIIIVIVVIVIVAAVAGIFLYLRMKTWGTVVECGECGAFIPENATKCPKCGTEFETEVVKCSECDAWIPALATECPKCGVEFKKNAAAAATVPPGGAQTPPPPGAEQPGAVAKVPKK